MLETVARQVQYASQLETISRACLTQLCSRHDLSMCLVSHQLVQCADWHSGSAMCTFVTIFSDLSPGLLSLLDETPQTGAPLPNKLLLHFNQAV